MHEYEFDDPTKWEKDPAGRSNHALHIETGDVVNLGEEAYRALFPRPKKADAGKKDGESQTA